ncbi:MAG TPA: LysR substrate-binding domain-containing protein [Geminicoccaceae bacterium]|nr:LysR substrate-binding domain-containing protein [Geminicoccus sp.]HMU48856.1 LysR substrate-binding domain-containing protein [Geminicoccaceae bacterium]
MDIADLAVFAAVADTGGITRAAERLGRVQSNVTARIKALELELGTLLFHRHSRGVGLTAAGRRLLPYAGRIAGLMAEAERAVREDDDVPRGRLVIGAMETTAAVRLPPLLARFRSAYPEVELAVSTGPTAELVDRVLAYELDAALVAGPIGHPEISEDAVFNEEMVLVTATGRPGLEAPPPAAIVFRAGCSYRRRLEALLLSAGYGAVRWQELGTLEGILGCVAADLGVTLLPRSVAGGHEAAGKVCCHPVPAPFAAVETMLASHRDGVPSAVLRALHATISAMQAIDQSQRK